MFAGRKLKVPRYSSCIRGRREKEMARKKKMKGKGKGKGGRKWKEEGVRIGETPKTNSWLHLCLCARWT